jgi:hypothetical protein
MKSPKRAFLDNLVYEHFGYPEGTAFPFDAINTHSPLYGKVDRNGDTCYLVSDEGSVENFKDASNYFAVNFVVRAFEDFRKSYKEALANGAEPIAGWTDLTPTSAWVDFEDLYAISLEQTRTFLIRNYLKQYSQEIIEFDDFMRVCLRLLQLLGEGYPLTRSSHLMSTAIPRAVSGLEISLFSPAGGAEESFRTNMIESNLEGFVSYTHKAANYGFWVNKRSPWILQANLASHRMQEYALRSGVKYNPGSASNFFEKYFMKAHLNDMDDIRAFFVGVYAEYITAFPYLKKTKYCGGVTVSKSVKRKLMEEVSEKYGVQYWLGVLVRVKLLETKMASPAQKRDIDKIVRRSMLAYRLYGLEKALNVVNTAIKKRNTALSSPGAIIFLDKPTKKSVYYNQVKPISGKSLYDWM